MGTIDWTCEVELTLEGHDLMIEGRIEAEGNYGEYGELCPPIQERVSVDRIYGCTEVFIGPTGTWEGGDEVELDHIPIHWWPAIKEAILDECQSQMEYEQEENYQ